ncbi:Cytochrome P450 monooxygenase sthF [Fulvia fulva]|uniref:Cytochrome P450 monooxygenase sthF n=1 Tax=Passalora fulva TaxID=5499 RepID=A0A9Q8LF89_PASFU|nr:Cytochrome P450 monooxygenase sthF [Fulvia fulva]KAK4627038.1 Cytochrome P450 monooxygenase sthF [Fulvia fulva]UJO16315.1 Cytochrome P450 monooxygenase sthF [Fulvia fulva]WPV14049.1 Cytochrome P450 monooxygenase sthF [Fulvia fulva]WPV28485.1 Cytochrome P450 monooxygenase sthF [Fulvia fulva]
MPLLSTWKLIKDYKNHQIVLKQVCDRRMALDKDKPDFMQHLMSRKGGISFSKEEIYSNAILITLGGAETTSNTLSGSVFMLATDPNVAAKVVEELHATFASEDKIDMRSASKLSYLNAVIRETLRYYPPGPNAMWRMTPPEGNTILGDWVPGNTVLSLHHRVIYRGEHSWRRPDEFLPERWLSEGKTSEFANDRRDGFYPFSYGPRSCLAMNLAYAEMRFILARLMWNFEIKIADKSRNWLEEQKAYLIWEKPGLHVHLTPRKMKEQS